MWNMIILTGVVIVNILITVIRLLLLKYTETPYLGLLIRILKNMCRNAFVWGLLAVKCVLAFVSGIILNYNSKLSILY